MCLSSLSVCKQDMSWKTLIKHDRAFSVFDVSFKCKQMLHNKAKMYGKEMENSGNALPALRQQNKQEGYVKPTLLLHCT